MSKTLWILIVALIGVTSLNGTVLGFSPSSSDEPQLINEITIIQTNQLWEEFVTPYPALTHIELSPDGKYTILSYSGSHGFHVLNTDTGEILFESPNDGYQATAFHPTLDAFAAIYDSEDQSRIEIWDLEDFTVLQTFIVEDRSAVYDTEFEFSSDGSLLAFVRAVGELNILDWRESQIVATFQAPTIITGIAFHPTDAYVAISTLTGTDEYDDEYSGRVAAIDPLTGEVMAQAFHRGIDIRSLGITYDGAYVIASTDNNNVVYYDANTFEVVDERYRQRMPYHFAAAQDVNLVFEDNRFNVDIINSQTQDRIASFTTNDRYNGGIIHLVASADGRRVVIDHGLSQAVLSSGGPNLLTAWEIDYTEATVEIPATSLPELAESDNREITALTPVLTMGLRRENEVDIPTPVSDYLITNDNRLITGRSNRFIYVIDLETYEVLATMGIPEFDGNNLPMLLTSDERYLITYQDRWDSEEEKGFVVYDLETYEVVHHQHIDNATHISYSANPDEVLVSVEIEITDQEIATEYNFVLRAGVDQEIQTWSLGDFTPSTFNQVGVWQNEFNTDRIELSKSGNYVLAWERDSYGLRSYEALESYNPRHDAHVLDAQTGEYVSTLTSQGQIIRVETSADDAFVTFAHEDIRLWRADGHLIRDLPLGLATEHPYATAKFSSDGQLLATTSTCMEYELCSTIQVWSAATGEMIAFNNSIKDIVPTVAFTPNNQQLIVLDHEANLHVMDIATGELSLLTSLSDLGPITVPQQDHQNGIEFIADGNQMLVFISQVLIGIVDIEYTDSQPELATPTDVVVDATAKVCDSELTFPINVGESAIAPDPRYPTTTFTEPDESSAQLEPFAEEYMIVDGPYCEGETIWYLAEQGDVTAWIRGGYTTGHDLIYGLIPPAINLLDGQPNKSQNETADTSESESLPTPQSLPTAAPFQSVPEPDMLTGIDAIRQEAGLSPIAFNDQLAEAALALADYYINTADDVDEDALQEWIYDAGYTGRLRLWSISTGNRSFSEQIERFISRSRDTFTEQAIEYAIVRAPDDELGYVYVLLAAVPNMCQPDIQENDFDLQIAEGEILLELVNEARAEEGLHPLTLDTNFVHKAARWYSDDMKAYGYPRNRPGGVPHVGTDGSSAKERVEREGYVGVAYRENIDSTLYFDTELSFVRWMNSPGHRRNILGDNISVMGYAFTCNIERGEFYYTQVFAEPFVEADTAVATGDVLSLINAERATNGLGILTSDTALEGYAVEAAEFVLANDDFPSDFWDRIRSVISADDTTAFVVYNNEGATGAFNQMMERYSDRLLNGDFDTIGIGVIGDENAVRNAYLVILVKKFVAIDVTSHTPELIELINTARQNNGLGTLTENVALAGYAQTATTHLLETNDYPSDFWDKVSAAGNFVDGGTFVVSGSEDSQGIFDKMIADHSSRLMKGNFNNIAIGIIIDEARGRNIYLVILTESA